MKITGINNYINKIGYRAPLINQAGRHASSSTNLMPQAVDSVSFTAAKNKTEPIYSMSSDGILERHNNTKEASSTLGIIEASIIAATKSPTAQANGHAFDYAENVEVYDENGEVVLDENGEPKVKASKINELFRAANKKAVYAVNNNGKYARYENAEEAADMLGLKKANINSCLSNSTGATGGYSFLRANDVESIDEQGRIIIDKKKIKEGYERANQAALYAVDINGNYQKFIKAKDAQETLGAENLSKIRSCLYRTAAKMDKYVYIRASEVEIYHENGKVTVDENKIRERLSEIPIKAAAAQEAEEDENDTAKYERTNIYAMDKWGEYQQFYGVTEASKQLGISREEILSCLSLSTEAVDGYTFSSDYDM